MEKNETYINDLLKQYREGSISAKDRHELERIALDDPFVFDSMEGYTLNSDPQVSATLDRIKLKTAAPQGRVINMRMISIAAGIAILIGGLFWVNGQLNQPDLESFSQLDAKEEMEEVNVTSSSEPIDGVAGFVGTEMGDLTANADPSELKGAFTEPIDTEASFAIENRILKREQQETAIVEDPPSIITVSNDGHQSATTTRSDDPYDYQYSVNDAVTSSEPEVASAPPPVAAPATSTAPAPSRARATEATGTIVKKKEVTAASDDTFGPAKTESESLEGNANFTRIKPKTESLQNRLIAGIVRDNTGEPLIGANILVPNSDIGVSTDIDGSFSLLLDSTVNELQIAYTGFTDFVMEIDTASSYDIVLDDDMAMLDEVVVVSGYASNVNDPEPAYVLPPDGRSAYKKVVQSKAESGCNESGKVKLKFTVTKYGEVTDFEIKKGLSAECNQRAIDIIKSSGTWNNQFNKDKKVRYTVSF